MTHQQYEPGYWTRRHTESVVLDIGADVGALVLYTRPELHQREIEVSPIGDDAARVHSAVISRGVGDRTVFAAVYPELRAGQYRVWGDATSWTVTITPGAVAELDWSATT